MLFWEAYEAPEELLGISLGEPSWVYTSQDWGRWFGFRVWENKRSRGGSNNLPYMLKFFEGIIITKLDVALLIMSLNFVSLDIHTLDGQNDTPVGRIQHHLMHEIFGIYICTYM